MPITTTITPFAGTLPARTQPPATFNTKVDAKLTWDTIHALEEISWTAEVNVLADELNAIDVRAAEAVVNAAASAASAMAITNFKGQWADLSGVLSLPASVLHDDVLWILINPLANITTSEPGVSTDWLNFNDFGSVAQRAEHEAMVDPHPQYGVSTNNLSDLANADAALINLGGTTIGKSVFKLTNSISVKFLRLNADNTVTARTADEARSDLKAQQGLLFEAGLFGGL